MRLRILERGEVYGCGNVHTGKKQVIEEGRQCLLTLVSKTHEHQVFFKSYCYVSILFFLAAPSSTWTLSSLTRDQTCGPCKG